MTQQRNRLRLGVEIECIFNSYLFDFEIGSYHNGIKKGKNWVLEKDSSIDKSYKFKDEKECEFISKTLNSKKSFFNALKEFQSFFEGMELNEVLYFNQSCGCHVHISNSLKNKNYFEKLTYEHYEFIRNLFFEKIDNSEILSSKTKLSIKNQYFRDYAKKIKKSDITYSDTPRSCEFNFQSEKSNKGLEWRSVNLRNVKNWNEFYEVFEIVYFCLENLYKIRNNDFKLKSKTIRINRTKLKNIIQKNQEKNIKLSLKPQLKNKEIINYRS